MLFIRFENRLGRSFKVLATAAAAVLLCMAAPAPTTFAKEVKPKGFDTPEAAVQCLVDALRKQDMAELEKVFGSVGMDVLDSGDAVADSSAREKFVKAFDEKHHVTKTSDGQAELVVGSDDWPFPIPIVAEKKKWVFDAEAGRDELTNRRIGRNELNTIRVLEAFVQAEREYFQFDYDEDGVLEYAQKLVSDQDKRDGLFWPVKEGEDPSPMGPLVAQAVAEGYKKSESGPTPYHGYFFKLLTGQGPDASGGAYSYIINGNMVAGYAVLAWPAEWDNSGLMTFMVNSNGVIYEKDLGEKTAEIAAGMNSYNPDSTWRLAR